MNDDTYRFWSFVKLPNSWGMVPESKEEGRFLFWMNSSFHLEMRKKKKKKRKKEKYNWVTLLGFEESQTIPYWPHKLLATFQFKVPFDANEL